MSPLQVVSLYGEDYGSRTGQDATDDDVVVALDDDEVRVSIYRTPP